MSLTSGLFRACVLACGCALLSGAGVRAQKLDVTAALALYESGQYPDFFAALANPAFDRGFYKTYEQEATRWINASGAPLEPRRRLVAASVALEIAHRLRKEPADRAARFLVWASLLMRREAAPVPSPAERWWHLACIAGMQELDEPWALTAGFGSGSSLLDPLARKLGAGGQLEAAVRRLPDEPRLRLAREQAREWSAPGWSPSYLEFARTGAAERVLDDPRTMDQRIAAGRRNQALHIIDFWNRLPELADGFRRLEEEPALHSEVMLHLGFLESTRGNSEQALDYLERARARATESYLKYLAQYLMGRVAQQRGDHPAAVDAFEKALALVPGARSAATQLAGELMLRGRAADRQRAYDTLTMAYGDSAPEDPWRLFPKGDARLWPTYMAQLRQAFR